MPRLATGAKAKSRANIAAPADDKLPAKPRTSESKWSPTVMRAGHVQVPNLLLDRQRGLGLDPTDLNILLHLMRHWYHADSLPFPGKRKIADCMDVSVSTVRRRIADLEKRGVLKRVTRRSGEHGGQQTNQYDLSGLVELLKPYATEALETKKKRTREDRETDRRKRPLGEITN